MMQRIGWITFAILGLSLIGCKKDKDGDGFKDKEDCDDNDPSVNPDADEICDGVDNNCNGNVDEGLVLEWYADADGDLYGDPGTVVEACNQPESYVNNLDDCDDASELVHPLALEIDCEDPVDYNCDGQTGFSDADADGHPACADCDDTNGDVSGPTTWYIDYDNDTYGSAYYSQLSCEQEIGWTDNAEDCDDLRSGVNPDTIWYTDADGDSYGDIETGETQCLAPSDESVRNSNDCDDTDAEVNPETLWFEDADGDGYGNPGEYQNGCEKPDGHAPNALDCMDDLDTNPDAAEINPDATEVCDVVDNDCDGSVDEDDAADARTYYLDSDGDGYGDDETTTVSCWPPIGYADVSGDCDDGLTEVNPGMEEICDDGLDNNCDSLPGECVLDLSMTEAVFVGGAVGDEAGIALSGIGDVNSDGLDDFVIGVKHQSDAADKAGAVFVVYGSDDLNGDVMLGGDGGSDTGSAPEVEMSMLTGINATDKAGRSVHGAGDVDGDAIPDLMISAPVADPGGSNSGQVYVVFAQDSVGFASGSLSDADVTISGRSENYLGLGMASGDLNGDEENDVLIGATGNDVGGPNTGTIFILYGPLSSGTEISTNDIDDYVTGQEDYAEISAVMDVADLDGDSWAELLIGDDANSAGGAAAGRLHIVSEVISGELNLDDVTMQFDGESSGDKLGSSVVSVGDVDGDGTGDLLVSAVLDDAGGIDAGAAYLMLVDMTTTSGNIVDNYAVKFLGESSGDGFGGQLAGGGDVDGDGADDFIVSSPFNSGPASGTGAAYVFYAGSLGTVSSATPFTVEAGDADVTFEGDAVDDKAGNALDFVGDIDGTSTYDAFLIGSSWDDAGGENAGAAYLIHGVGL
jgi:hypothetical protein